MSLSESNEAHPLWGRTIADYPKNCNIQTFSEYLDTPLDGMRRLFDRKIALETIKDICILGQSGTEKSEHAINASRITIPCLKAVLGLLRFPSEYQNFALPPLVEGCIELISSVKPSPFYYEYGYLSFHLMVVALTAYLLSYGQCLDPGRDDTTAPSNILQDFWEDCATLISPEIIPKEWEGTKLIRVPESPPSQLWTNPDSNSWKPRLNTLLNILHNDWKYFLPAMKRTRLLPLSGMMFLLRSLVPGTWKEPDGRDSSTRPHELYASTLCICRLVDSPFPREHELLTGLSNRVPPSYITAPEYKDSIELQGSRSVMRAYVNFLERSQTCASAIGRFAEEVLGANWRAELSKFQLQGVCGNPRCPIGFGARYTCHDLDVLFCGSRCIANGMGHESEPGIRHEPALRRQAKHALGIIKQMLSPVMPLQDLSGQRSQDPVDVRRTRGGSHR
ncbi:unnamed protein product [Rhizoctonia solani]|uniref:Uncharacterized protein n=1 Tax=Rhizoctonia solani TaxID=456999 RepID=A0A8H3HUT2_9AGAM|nr:unnamed protein product [Rhizoctonia solani]